VVSLLLQFSGLLKALSKKDTDNANGCLQLFTMRE
jgi:hypothetical protein